MRETNEKMETRKSVTLNLNGQQIFGMLHRPISEKKTPIVVIFHGFASSKIGSNRSYVNISEHFSKQGIASFRFDFRGSGDSEGSLAELSFEDLVEDALCVLQNVVQFEGIDSNRIALFGTSLGATIATFAAHRSQKVKTMALWAPVASGMLWYQDFLNMYPEFTHVDPEKILSSYKGRVLHPLFREQFYKMKAHDIFEKLSSLPILHMHGEKDKTVSLKHQEAFKEASQKAPSQAQFITYPQSEHALGYSPDFQTVLNASTQWFQKHLI